MPAPRARSSTEISCSGRSSSSRSAVARIAASRSSPLTRAARRPRAGAATGWVGGHDERDYSSRGRVVQLVVDNIDSALIESSAWRAPRSNGTWTAGRGARRRADRRRRPLGHRRRLPPAADAARARASRSSRRATAIGGTWDLFRYPGIRSDSDMFTLGYSFKPWERAEGARRRPLDPRLHPRDRRRHGDRATGSASSHAWCGAEWSSERRALDGRARARRRPASAARLTCSLPVRLHRLLPLRRGLHARRSQGIERFGGDDRPSAALARGPRLRGQARGRDRQRRHRRHARPGDGRQPPST